jgi:enolase-phosphatase E1
VPHLKEWHAGGIQLAIFSSGSVAAQKLLFQHVGIENDNVTEQNDEGKSESVEGQGLADASSRKRKHNREGSPERSQKAVRLDEEEGGDNEDSKETLKKPEQTTGAERKVKEQKQEGEKDREEEEVPEEKVQESSLPEKPKSSIDLTHLFSGFFDTVNGGPKTEKESYIKIATELGRKASEVLFLSDNVHGKISVSRVFSQNLVSFPFPTWRIMYTFCFDHLTKILPPL